MRAVKHLAAAALVLALGLAATAASAQVIALGSPGNFGEGMQTGLPIDISNPVTADTIVTFRVTYTGGPAEENLGTLLSTRGANTRFNAISGSVATGTNTIRRGTLTGNAIFFVSDVDHLPDGTTRVFTLTLLSAVAGSREIALHSDPARLSFSTTITYDAPNHRLALTTSPTSIAENDSGVTATYTVTRTGPRIYNSVQMAPVTANITYDVRAGTAAAADFIGGSLPRGTFSYSDMGTTASFDIGIAGDNLNEAGEDFTIHFSIAGGSHLLTANSQGGFLVPRPLTVTINDDDDITYAIGSDGSAAEGNSGGAAGEIRLPVTLGGDIAVGGQYTTITVPFTIDSGSTAGDSDYSIAPNDGNLQFDVGSGGSLTADIVITAVPNNLNEADKTVIINLGPAATGRQPAGGGIIMRTGTAADQSATATINDDDGLEVRIARRAGQTGAVAESGSAGFTVSLVLARDNTMAGVDTADICVAFDMAIASQQNPTGMANTAENADVGAVRDCDGNTVAPDAAGAASGGLLIPAGQSEGSFSILARYDDIDEGATDEQLTVTITGATHRPAPTGDLNIDSGNNQVSVNIENLNEDIEPPRFDDPANQPGWSGGQQVVWVRINEDFKVLPHPGGGSGATVSSATASLTGPNALPAGDFMVVENAGSSSATIAVSGVTPFADVRALRLELQRAIAADAANITIAYERSGGANAIYDIAVEQDLARNNMRNALTRTTTGPLTPSATNDFDTDGIPDAVEAGIRGAAGNPLVAVTDAQQPAFTISRTASPERVAYSGIREHGVRAHLGVSSVATTTQTAAQTVTAYYRSGTFGYDGTYACTGQFPANYDAPLSAGGCAPVDWGDIVPGEEHTIAWLARTADGVWAVNTGTDSNLPEQTIERIPELNMASQALFTTGASVVVRAFFDHTPAAGLTLALSRTADETGETTMVQGSGAGRTLAATDTSPVSALWAITGLTAGSASRLYRPNTPTAGFTPNYPASTDHSLGLARQTRVLHTGGAPVPPVLGRAVLSDSSGNIHPVVIEDTANVATIGSYRLNVPIENYADIGAGTTASASDASGVLNITSRELMAAADGAGVYRVGFVVRANVRATTDTAVIRVAVTGADGGMTTAEYRYPILAGSSYWRSGSASADSDGDGIDDTADAYDDSAHLPVVVDDVGVAEATAGAKAWHHIRPVLPVHGLHVGEATVLRVVEAEMGSSFAPRNYATFSASSVPADGSFAVVYDFEIAGVDYAQVSADARTGGVAGVIIPLPESLAGSGASLMKVRSDGTQAPFSVAGENDYGFAPLQEDGACPDDTMAAGSPYREGETLRRAKRGDDACLVVYIVDGGANDEDGTANGIIKDPLGVRAGNAAGVGGGGSSSGAFGPATLAALTILAALLLLSASRQRRRRPT